MDDTLLDFIKNFFDQLGISDILNLEIFNGIKDEFLKLIVNPLSNFIVSHILKTKDYQTNLNAIFSVLIVNLYIYYGYKISKSIISKNKREIKMTNQLIIIGNGFDLACGLKSSYGDFFREYFKERLQNDKEIKKNINNNFWFEWFYETKKNSGENEYTWAAIEDEIKNSINKIYVSYQSFFSANNLLMAEIIKNRLKKNDTTIFNLSDKIPKEDFFKILFSDLERVESEFISYLENQIASNNSYKNNVNKLISRLILDNNQGNLTEPNSPVDANTKILSFNYTNEFTNKNNYFCNRVTNIHGSLKNKDAIFGIDNEDGKNSLTIDFTKKFRILFSKNKYPFKLDENVQKIKFYGHSLSDADFTHFKYIFDKANLSEGRVELIFFFSELKNEPIRETRIKLVKKLNDFINKYGSKIGVDNLFDTLFIEGRVSVQELNVSEVLK